MAFTFFFRDHHTLSQVIKYFLPLVKNRQKIKIWDAGCAMGPEPYTFLILLSENMDYWNFKKVEMDATDIDESGNFGEIISNGIYEFDTIKRIPEDILKKYFTKYNDNNYYIIDDKIKSRLKFHHHDLLSLKPISYNYNLIICKNVLLHFNYEQRINVYKMFYDALDSEGLIVTEQTQELPKEVENYFEKLALDAQIFRKK